MNPSISASTASVTGGTAFSLQAEKPSAGQRWISFGEFLLGSAIVIGHNVYRVVPNEVPILFVFALISFRLRDGWSALGLRWPASWRRTILIAVAAAVLRLLVGTLVIEPVTAHFWPPAIAPSGMKDIAGHGIEALKWFLLVWTFAAFGEEIGYRGYLLNRAADAGGRSKAVYWLAVVLVSVLFGYGQRSRQEHAQQIG